MVELLVVITIIGILVALILPAVQGAREAARRTHCLNQMHQISVAMHNFHSTKEHFPPGVEATDDECPPRDGTERAPWTVAILTYMQEQPRYDEFDLDERFVPRFQFHSANHRFQFQPVSFYKCPANSRSNETTVQTDYVGCAGGGAEATHARCTAGRDVNRPFYDNGIFFINSKISTAQITDGSANTYMVGETIYMRTPADPGVGNNYPSWAAGMDAYPSGTWSSYQTLVAAVLPINTDALNHLTNSAMFMRIFASEHPGGCHMAMADGSVHFVRETIDLNVHRALGARNDELPTQGNFQ